MNSHPLIVRAQARIDVVAAVIIRDRRMLLTQRQPSGTFPLRWECPGGWEEGDEGHEAALLRELREELGVEARLTGPACPECNGRGWHPGDCHPREQCGACCASGRVHLCAIDFDPPIVVRPLRWVAYRAEIVFGEPRPLVAVDLRWCDAADLASLPMTPANEAKRPELIALLSGGAS